jgi:transcription initiation factor IIE alpha subunit
MRKTHFPAKKKRERERERERSTWLLSSDHLAEMAYQLGKDLGQ